jgi:hypothetical protein
LEQLEFEAVMTRATLDPANIEVEWIEVMRLTPFIEMLTTGVMASAATKKTERVGD